MKSMPIYGEFNKALTLPTLASVKRRLSLLISIATFIVTNSPTAYTVVSGYNALAVSAGQKDHTVPAGPL